MARMIHVSKKGNDGNTGERECPFYSITKAANTALPGDRIIVHEGVYREWVSPMNGGWSPYQRITYEAAEGEKVVIKGSEKVEHWERVEGSAWKAVVSNEIFGEYNPFLIPLEGDWLLYPETHTLHLGDVYMNGQSFYEAQSLDEVKNPKERRTGYNPPWTNHEEVIRHPEQTLYVWYAEVGNENTMIYANFQGRDPNKELVEINVRPYCFYPKETGVNYITVKGFEMAQAACPWVPPTAEQPGLLGTHWSKGWIIEDNIIHDAKCSGISIGKEKTTGHNFRTRYCLKPGYQNQLESVFAAVQKGWSKETIGSHIIRRNKIYDCGQNGIVGHMGCVFSQIYENHIYNIGEKHEFFGYEIAGIKLHAAIDVEIKHNNIHHSTLGLWLDWQAQGTRVSKNLFYENNRDFMIEVTHGPCIVDHNIFASEYNFDNQAQGTAFLHNLCMGTMILGCDPNRSTPYHFAHSTQVAGYAVVYGGDDRWMRNIFVGGGPQYAEKSYSGTCGYDGHTTSLQEYIEKVQEGGIEDMRPFMLVKQPVMIQHNSYFNGAKPFEREEKKYECTENITVDLQEEGDAVYLNIEVPKTFVEHKDGVLNSEELGMVRIVSLPYEDGNGNPILFSTDYLDEERIESSVDGPFANLKQGQNRVCVWKA